MALRLLTGVTTDGQANPPRRRRGQDGQDSDRILFGHPVYISPRKFVDEINLGQDGQDISKLLRIHART
jgi:hypothetical protein